MYATIIQVTIEHDPDVISKKKVSLPVHKYSLTTTASDTNIPHNDNEELYNSNRSVDNKNLSSTSIDSLNRHKSNPDIKDLTASNTSAANNNNNNNGSTKTAKKAGIAGNKERLFKRRDEGYMSGTRSRQLKRKNNLCENRQTLDKERSSSMSRLLDE